MFDQSVMDWANGSHDASVPAVSIGWAPMRCQRAVRRMTWSARAKSASTSPKSIERANTTLLSRVSCTSGASASIAATGSTIAGRTS